MEQNGLYGIVVCFRTVMPNEHTRVTLPGINEDPLSSYINANWIRVSTTLSHQTNCDITFMDVCMLTICQ